MIPQYLLAVAWQNVAYNQPAHLVIYIGEGMNMPMARPNIVTEVVAQKKN